MNKVKLLCAFLVTVLAFMVMQNPHIIKGENVSLLAQDNTSYIEKIMVDSDEANQNDIVIVDTDEVVEGGISFVYNKVSDSEPGSHTEYFEYIYDSLSNLISRKLRTDKTEIVAATQVIISNGQKLEPGAFYRCKLATAYGVDCELCNGRETGVGRFASGINASTTAVQQPDGEWLDGITYDGYYVIATSTRIPLCTVVEVSEHSYYGNGLEAGVPFEAIVLDRGVTGSAIDLFAGGEQTSQIRNGKNRSPLITVKYMGKIGTNQYGRRGCIIDYDNKDTVE